MPNMLRTEYKRAEISGKIRENIGKKKLHTATEQLDLWEMIGMSDRKIITMKQCRDLRMMIMELTRGCMITQDEYRQLCVVINKILSRMEKEENERSKMD